MIPADDSPISGSEDRDRILRLLTTPGLRPEALGTILLARRLQVPPDAVAPCLLDPSEATRVLALEALCAMGAPAVDVIVAALEPSQPINVRVGGAMALGRLGPDAAPAAGPLAASLQSEEPLVRFHAGLALSQIGPQALPHVLPLLKEPDQETVRVAATVLGRMGEAAVDALETLQTTAAQSSSLHARLACLVAVTAISKDPALGINEMLPLLDHEDAALRRACLDAIRESGRQEDPVREKVLERLHDADAIVRAGAALTLARVEPDAKKALPHLLPLLSDDDLDVRTHTAMALAHYGPEAAEATAPLEALFTDDTPELRAVAAAALSRIRGEDHV